MQPTLDVIRSRYRDCSRCSVVLAGGLDALNIFGGLELDIQRIIHRVVIFVEAVRWRKQSSFVVVIEEAAKREFEEGVLAVAIVAARLGPR